MQLNKKQKTICVIGLGNIGLPTACVLAASGYAVLGVDVNEKVLLQVQSAKLNYSEPNLQELLKEAIQNESLKVSRQVASSDVYIITVPTPLGPNKQPDISYVLQAIESIRPHLRTNDLILIESTCPIGTTESIAMHLRPTYPAIQVAYCPERVIPGHILYELIHNDRIVGGIDQAATVSAINFYKSFVKGEVLATTASTAEAVKLAENTYRDINIAFANELSMIAEHININVNEVIQLANRHPRVQILNPGPGVGGHCIAVDPWFLISSAPHLATLSRKARDVNLRKTEWVIERIKRAIKMNNAKTIACLGLTYKANVSVLTESPALAIVQALEKEVRVLCVDPYVSNTHALDGAINQADIVVGLVAHKEFLNMPSTYLKDKIVLDFGEVFL